MVGSPLNSKKLKLFPSLVVGVVYSRSLTPSLVPGEAVKS